MLKFLLHPAAKSHAYTMEAKLLISQALRVRA